MIKIEVALALIGGFLLLVLLGLGLALQNVRNVSLFVAAVTPVLIGTYGGWWKELASTHRWTFNLRPRKGFAIVTSIVLVLIAVVTAVRVENNINPAHQATLDSQTYPVAAADWLDRHPELGTRMFNQYGWGGYLAYRFYPNENRRVFIFGEAALMGDGLLNDYEHIYTLHSDWKALLDKYCIDYVVENKGDPLPNVLATQPDWTLAYQDSVAVIYVRPLPGCLTTLSRS